MKKNIKKAKKKLKQEIEFAQKAGFAGIMLSLDDMENYLYLESIYDDETLEEMVRENGLSENCAVLDFTNNRQQLIFVCEVV